MKQFFRTEMSARGSLAAVLLLSLYLVWCCASLLEWDLSGNLISHSYSVWGDWSAHFTFIQNLRERGLHWLAGDNPVFAGAPFQYPFLSHLITAAFGGTLGISTIAATEFLSLVLLFVAPFALYKIFRQFGLKGPAGFVSTAVFFLAGGFQWMGLFNPSAVNPHEPLTNHFDNGSVFTQFVAFEFYPQRAFLFGILMLCGIGLLALRRVESGKFRAKTAIWTGLGFSLLALTHVHSFLAFAAFLLFYFAFHRNKKVFLYGLGIAVAGCGFLAFLLLHDRRPDLALSWNIWLPGWALNSSVGIKATQEMNPFSFWMLNSGLYLPLAWAGAWFAWRERDAYPLARVWICAGIFLFVLANFFNLQPYWYDNLKTFTYSFFFFAPLIGVFFERVLFTRKALIPVAAVVFVTQIFAGASDLQFLHGKAQNATFFTAAEFNVADEFKRLRSAPDDLVLFAPRHNHWVTCLAGSPALMGFTGWLWSWGINYGERERDVNEILLGGARARQLLDHYDVKYVALNQNDRAADKPVALDFFRSQFLRILNRDGWEIFSVKSPATSVR